MMTTTGLIYTLAEVMADMALELGIRPEDIIIESRAVDTKDHPIRVKEIFGDDLFILVTSATHMPRAMALFRKHNMHPIPAPTDYLAMKKEGDRRTEVRDRRSEVRDRRTKMRGRWKRLGRPFMSIWG